MSSSNTKFVNKLQGKKVLVFGGTSGIGYGIVEGLLEHGANVIISGSNPEKLQKAVQRLKETYVDVADDRIATAVADLSEPEKLEARLSELFDKVTNGGANKIDHISFSAGDARDMRASAFPNYTPEIIFNTFKVRLLGPLFIAKFIPKYVNTSPDSSFTLTSGTLTARPEKGWTLGAASGGAIQGAVKSLAIELAPVRVNVVAPGLIETELTENMLKGDTRTHLEQNTVLTKRVGRPEDTAEAYLYMMRDGFITGTLLSTDGGRLLLGPK